MRDEETHGEEVRLRKARGRFDRSSKMTIAVGMLS